jgi:hypothetical protein
MLRIQSGSDDHEKFKKLCALAVSGILAPFESMELQAHLRDCESCHEVFRQYQVLATQGMIALTEEFTENQGQASWDTTPVLEQVLARVRTDLRMERKRKTRELPAVWSKRALDSFKRASVWIPVAACLILSLTFAAYHFGARSRPPSPVQSPLVYENTQLRQLADEKTQANEVLVAKTRDLVRLEAENSDKQNELAKVKSELQEVEGRASKLQSDNSESQAQLLALTQQRNTLTAQLEALTKTYESEKAELANLRIERDGMLMRTNSLEAKVAELISINKDQERRLNDADQYLSSDRDIRELMGARKLYIADVFDVDGSSRTQKPFGRVFYTQGKSLIFYAFDLDHEPGVVNASAFQVWGQHEVPQGQQVLPMNLGILYMDNEKNRRWVMRFDDPKKLAEIDSVFVTVEPHGGSPKPTSKPFLYALLRNEPNHP